MRLSSLIVMLVSLLFVQVVFSQERVTPIASVQNGVNVRKFPTSDDAEVVSKLRLGEVAEVVDTIPYWYEIQLPNGRRGFVSKRWVKKVAIGAASASSTPFQFHVVDVGIGDGLVLDMETREVIVDGGMHGKHFKTYVDGQTLIQGPIELAIVTHADSDHWRGMSTLLGLKNPTPAHRVLEFWEPGYDRGCNALETYTEFIDEMSRLVPTNGFFRPLQSTHSSANVQSFTVSQLPGVTFTMLHTDKTPTGPNCAYQINNASIVMRVDVGGIRMLWTGDANGKDRDEDAMASPRYVEQRLLELEQQHPGILKADILKVSHHGSETASMTRFINAVKPRFAIISASTNHNLPRETVVRRYEDAGAVVLRTDQSRTAGNDHIVCIGNGAGDVDCNYADIIE